MASTIGSGSPAASAASAPTLTLYWSGAAVLREEIRYEETLMGTETGKVERYVSISAMAPYKTTSHEVRVFAIYRGPRPMSSLTGAAPGICILRYWAKIKLSRSPRVGGPTAGGSEQQRPSCASRSSNN